MRPARRYVTFQTWTAFAAGLAEWARSDLRPRGTPSQGPSQPVWMGSDGPRTVTLIRARTSPLSPWRRQPPLMRPPTGSLASRRGPAAAAPRSRAESGVAPLGGGGLAATVPSCHSQGRAGAACRRRPWKGASLRAATGRLTAARQPASGIRSKEQKISR